jgi:excisionase family DNA binding protein
MAIKTYPLKVAKTNQADAGGASLDSRSVADVSAATNGRAARILSQLESSGTSGQRAEQLFEPLLDDRQASALLGGIHPKTLQRLARTGQIPAYRVGRSWKYRASELDNWLRSKVNSAGQLARVDSTQEIT